MNRTNTRSPVSVIDLGVQNVGSVVNALETIGASTRVVTEPGGLGDAGLVVVPGVGSFASASRRLAETGLGSALRSHVTERDRPLFGMCLGMQLLADTSAEHGTTAGLGLIPGSVVRLREKPPNWRVPNIGWRDVCLVDRDSVMPDALDRRAFYHVHSFHLVCDDAEDVVGRTWFGEDWISVIVQRGNVVGTQFHPEKSQDAGLDLLHAVWRELG